MKIVVNKQVIDDNDIKDVQLVTPEEYHIADMLPFIAITLKNGEKIYTDDEITIYDKPECIT